MSTYKLNTKSIHFRSAKEFNDPTSFLPLFNPKKEYGFHKLHLYQQPNNTKCTQQVTIPLKYHTLLLNEKIEDSQYEYKPSLRLAPIASTDETFITAQSLEAAELLKLVESLATHMSVDPAIKLDGTTPVAKHPHVPGDISKIKIKIPTLRTIKGGSPREFDLEKLKRMVAKGDKFLALTVLGGWLIDSTEPTESNSHLVGVTLQLLPWYVQDIDHVPTPSKKRSIMDTELARNPVLTQDY